MSRGLLIGIVVIIGVIAMITGIVHNVQTSSGRSLEELHERLQKASASGERCQAQLRAVAKSMDATSLQAGLLELETKRKQVETSVDAARAIQVASDQKQSLETLRGDVKTIEDAYARLEGLLTTLEHWLKEANAPTAATRGVLDKVTAKIEQLEPSLGHERYLQLSTRKLQLEENFQSHRRMIKSGLAAILQDPKDDDGAIMIKAGINDMLALKKRIEAFLAELEA